MMSHHIDKIRVLKRVDNFQFKLTWLISDKARMGTKSFQL